MISLFKSNIIDLQLMSIIFLTIYFNGFYLLSKIPKIDKNIVSLQFGIGSLPISFAATFLLFFGQLSLINVIILLVLLQYPLVNWLITNRSKIDTKKLFSPESYYISFIVIIFLFIIISSTEFLTSGDKYRWIAIGEFVSNKGYVDVSYDFRNMSPFYAETFLLLGMVLRNESLALMINTFFPLFLTISIFEFLNKEKNVPKIFSLLMVLLFISNHSFLIDSIRGYISSIVALYLWLVFYCLYKWINTKNINYYFISIIFAGFASGTKIHGLFCVILFSVLIFARFSSKNKPYFNIKNVLYPSFFLLGSILISSPWYIKNVFYTGDLFYPYLSSNFYANIGQNSSLTNPENWSGVEPTFVNFFQSIFILIKEPNLFLYGLDFGILFFALIPFLFLDLNNKKNRLINVFSIFFIFSYYSFWFFTHQNVRYLLYVYPIVFSLGMVNLFYYSKLYFNIRFFRFVAFFGIFLMSINGLFHIAMFSNWWIKYKSISKEEFMLSDSNPLRCLEIDRIINNDLNENPRVISNLRDLLYLETPVKYENVWYDNIVSNKTNVDLDSLIKKYKMNGYTHLIFKDFGNSDSHKRLLEVGCTNITEITDNFTIYRL